MSQTPRFALRLTALAAAAATAAPWAAAQTSPATKDVGIQEVVISAERRLSSIQKTAASVSATSGEDLREKGQVDLGQVLADTPAVQVQASPQGGQVFVRGVGANGDSNWVDPAVAISLDGVYSGRAERVFSAMYDVARVEVLRGPQGTLYGRNATGGAVNVITNDPGRKLEGGLSMQVGNYNLAHVDGFINVPLGETLSARVALMREKRDGYFSNGGRESDLSAGRLKVLFKPDSRFSLLATVDSFDSKGAGMTTVPRAYDSAVPPFVTWRTDYSSPWEVDPQHPADQQRTRFNTASVQAEWDLGPATLTLLPAYTKSKRYVETSLITGTAAGSTLPFAGSTWEETQRTLEARLASPRGAAVQWVAGAYSYSSDNVQTGTPPSYPPPTYEAYDTKVPAKSNAVFGQASFPVATAMRLTTGLRYTRDEKTYHYGLRSTSASTVVGYDSGLREVSKSYSSLTYKLGGEYDLAPQSLLYAQVASGYKAGGFSTAALPPQPYEPEKLVALEIGSKNRFFNNTLQINAEAYYYRYNNYQVQYADYNMPSPVPGDNTSGFALYVVNAGAGRNTGFEVETKLRVAGSTELRAALTSTRARYGNFSVAALSALSGTRVASTPRWTATLGVEHQWEVGSGTLTAGGQIKFSDGYRATLETGLPGGDANNTQASFHKSDLRIAYSPDSERWSLALWARNLENKAQTTGVLPFGRTFITDPRTVGLNGSVKF